MLKLLIVLAVVVGLALWLLKRRPASGGEAGQAANKKAGAEPAKMVACAHCGLHLPRPEASYDAEGRAFCGEAHRIAGPR